MIFKKKFISVWNFWQFLELFFWQDPQGTGSPSTGGIGPFWDWDRSDYCSWASPIRRGRRDWSWPSPHETRKGRRDNVDPPPIRLGREGGMESWPSPHEEGFLVSCGIGGVNCSIDWGIDRSQLFAQVEAASERRCIWVWGIIKCTHDPSFVNWR